MPILLCFPSKNSVFKTNFQFGHSTEHAILQLANQIHETMEKNLFTFGAFIDLSEVFDTVNHSMILAYMQKSWMVRKLFKNIKQYVQIDDDKRTEI